MYLFFCLFFCLFIYQAPDFSLFSCLFSWAEGGTVLLAWPGSEIFPAVLKPNSHSKSGMHALSLFAVAYHLSTSFSDCLWSH